MFLFKSLTGSITRNRLFGVWEDPSNSITDGQVYQWRSTFNINVRIHSDPLTSTPYEFNGLDIQVGMWVGDFEGRVYKIIGIESVTPYSGIFHLEDVGLVNSINDSSGSFNGTPVLGNCVIFNLSEDGIPIIDGLLENDYQAVSISNINSRFAKENPKTLDITIYQTNNGFSVGDFIKVDNTNSNGFMLCDVDDINNAVGVVSTINNPKTDYFTFRPLNEIIDNVQPDLIGNYGDIFYLDPANPGKVTNVKPLTGKVAPVYIRLDSPNRAVRLNAITDDNTVSVIFKSEVTSDDQIEFILPQEAEEVLVMSINGIENKNYIYDRAINTLTFDPIATGYGVETSDEVIFTYNKLA